MSQTFLDLFCFLVVKCIVFLLFVVVMSKYQGKRNSRSLTVTIKNGCMLFYCLMKSLFRLKLELVTESQREYLVLGIHVLDSIGYAQGIASIQAETKIFIRDTDRH